jgi:hypothetical protein
MTMRNLRTYQETKQETKEFFNVALVRS